MGLLDDLSFPILAISADSLTDYPSPDALAVASPTGVANGYFDRLWLLDQRGLAFQVIGVEVARESFWKRPKTPFGRGVRVTALRIEPLAPPSLDEVKRHVADSIERDREIWEEGEDVSELLARTSAAGSAAALIAALS